MKKLLLYTGFILCTLLVKAQGDFEKVNIRILPQSELFIAGSTNVNKFNCQFNIDLISDWKKIKFSREDNFLNFKDLKLNLLIDGFDCGNKRMNADFQELLMCDIYPEIQISIDRIELISHEYTKTYITVELAGMKNYYELPVETSTNTYKGRFKMNIRDFGLEPPKKALGLIEVDEQIEVIFNLKTAF